MKLYVAKFIYQAIWFGILSHFYKRKVTTNILLDNSKRFAASLKLAKFISEFFQSPIIVLIGDSNSEVFANYKSAMKFNAIAVTMGMGGSRPDTWVDYFASGLDESREVYQLLLSIENDGGTIIWNIGRNSVLQRSMDNAYSSLARLHTYFPSSWNITIPPIHYSILSHVYDDIFMIESDVRTINSYILDLWKGHGIDLGSFLQNPFTGEALVGTLSDPVHYGQAGKDIITLFINTFIIPRMVYGS
jgi:hypothetical protein